MSVEEKRNCAEEIGTLSSCLIEADPEQKARERKIKRRALIISVVLQSAAIVTLVLVPLLGRTERLAFNIVTPMPPYRPMPNRPVGDPRPAGPRIHGVCFDCIHNVPSKPEIEHLLSAPGNPEDPDLGGGIPIPGGVPGGNTIGSHRAPVPPEEPEHKKRRITVGGDVQGAMLIHRVEPQYPALARQLGRSGTVHIRAVISTEGNIESLQVLDGDPLLVQSARDAVSQWHYRPTMLNGVPVEVETIIAITYTLNR